MARHGRAVMPFGKYRGIHLRLIPSEYLSYLTTFPGFKEPQWDWLLASLISELRFRGLEVSFDLEQELMPEPITKRKRRITIPTMVEGCGNSENGC